MELLKIIGFCILVLIVEAFLQGIMVTIIDYEKFHDPFFIEVLVASGAFLFYKLIIELWLFVSVSCFRSAFRDIVERDLIIGKIASSILIWLVILAIGFGNPWILLITYPFAVFLSYLLMRKLWKAVPKWVVAQSSEST